MSCAARERAPHRAAEADQRQHDHRDRARARTADRRGLVTTIMAAAPTNSTRLRNAIETEAPTADLIWVVSAVSREISSPVLARVEEGGRKRGEMGEHVGAQVGDDALAERGDEVEARRAREREHGHDRDHHGEIAVDQARCARREKPKSIMRRTASGTASVATRRDQRARAARRARARGSARDRAAAIAAGAA